MVRLKAAKKIRERLNIGKPVQFPKYAELVSLVLVMMFTAACLFIGYSQKPVVYPVDYGQYERILDEVGLKWTEEDIALGNWRYERPLTEFAYTHYSWTNLMTPGAGRSVVYLVAVIRLLTEPFGRYFSVDMMAAECGIILFLAVVFLSIGLRRLAPRVWFIPVGFLSLLFTNGNYYAMFRGFYPEGPAVLFFLLFAGFYLYVWSIPPDKRGFRILFPVIISFLMLKAAAPMAVFLPLAAVADLALIFHSFTGSGRSNLITAVSLLFLLTGCVSTVRLAKSDLDYFSEASFYESAFNTMLPAAENRELLLLEFGLDQSYLADVGKSYYEDNSHFVHDPKNPDEAMFLFANVNAESITQLYLLHPNLLTKIIQNAPVDSKRFFENPRYRQIHQNNSDYVISRSDGGLFSVFWAFLPHSYGLFLVYAFIQILICIPTGLIKKTPAFLLKALYMAGCIAYLPFCVILNGYSLAPQYYLIQQFLELLFLIDFVSVAVCLFPIIQQWISVYMVDPYQMPSTDPLSYHEHIRWNRVKSIVLSAASYLVSSRLHVMLLTLIMGGLMLLVYLPDDHPVGVNNGDFGRMMEQLDLMWTGDVYFDSAQQMGRSGIEEFHYLRPFDPLKLTPLKPTFTLYWFASLVRLVTEPFGRPFSTRILAFIMSSISLLCVAKIVYDLYPFLKKWTAVAAFVLCTIFYSETILTWYNSLFGESCILLGLIMSLTCIIHLCLMLRSSKSSLLWLVALFFSLYIMTGAKSQMLVTVPFAVIVFIVLAVYHKPYRYDLFALYGLLSLTLSFILVYSAFGIYRSERTEKSTSQKHTMWQAYFYGIFMIADDPIGDMEALGVDTAMAQDIGKYVQFDDPSQYVYAPLSDEAQTAFYDHVSMLTIIKWYLSHPAKLWYMLDYAAEQAQTLYNGFRVYNGQDYSDPIHDNVDGMNLWPGWRSYWTPGKFLGYILFYGILMALLMRNLWNKDIPIERKIYCCIPLFLITVGVIQFPLSVLGNGFVDNQKQMFGFVLCHDLIMAGILVFGARHLYHMSLYRKD